MIRNINEKFGDSIETETVEQLETLITECGYSLPEDGLQEGRDYETVD